MGELILNNFRLQSKTKQKAKKRQNSIAKKTILKIWRNWKKKIIPTTFIKMSSGQ